jgi:hypothetical protein
MDVAEFFSGFRRMCKSSSDCAKCEYHGDKCNNVIDFLEKTVAGVEQWSREHPRKTRQSVFMEQYPETVLDEHGVLSVCPLCISSAHRDSNGSCKEPEKRCTDCRREFWMQEVE